MSRAIFLALSFLFVLPVQAADDRQVVELSVEQRDFALGQMRAFLEGIQDIILATSEGDMEAVKETAQAFGMGHAGQPGMGRGMGQGQPGQGRGRGGGFGIGRMAPQEFRLMAQGMHAAFDSVVQAADMGPEAVLEELGVLMSNCTGCHANFKLVEKR